MNAIHTPVGTFVLKQIIDEVSRLVVDYDPAVHAANYAQLCVIDDASRQYTEQKWCDIQPIEYSKVLLLISQAEYTADELLGYIHEFSKFGIKETIAIPQHFTKRFAEFFPEPTPAELYNNRDFNLSKYVNRKMPSYNSADNVWRQVNIAAAAEEVEKPPMDYGLAKDAIGSSSSAPQESFEINNFAVVQILEKCKYDLSVHLERLCKMVQIGKMSEFAILYAMSLAFSFKTCHVIKCAKYWDCINMLEPAFENQFAQILIKIARHAMYLLRHEETLTANVAEVDGRCIFSLEEANILSNAKFNFVHPPISPFFVQLLGKNSLRSHVLMAIMSKSRRVVTPIEFKHRFSLATGGIFDKIDLRKFNAAITGSILVPCAHVSPLEAGSEFFIFGDSSEPIVDSRSFTAIATNSIHKPNVVKYVKRDESDVGDDGSGGDDNVRTTRYPLTASTDVDAIDHVVYCAKYMHDSIVADLARDSANRQFIRYLEYYYPSYRSLLADDWASEVMRAPSEEGVPFAEPADVIAAAKNSHASLADIDISITASTKEEYTALALALYEEIKSNAKYPVFAEVVVTANSSKYKLYGPGLTRPIDLFHIHKHPELMVRTFHLNCVKMYYDGDLHMLRSCVASLQSGISESYSWFSCNKIPADIFLKYARRGISIVFNTLEKNAFARYLSTAPDYVSAFNMPGRKLFDFATPNCSFFRECDIFRKGLVDMQYKGEITAKTVYAAEPKYSGILQNDTGFRFEAFNAVKIAQMIDSIRKAPAVHAASSKSKSVKSVLNNVDSTYTDRFMDAVTSAMLRESHHDMSIGTVNAPNRVTPTDDAAVSGSGPSVTLAQQSATAADACIEDRAHDSEPDMSDMSDMSDASDESENDISYD